MKQKIWFCFFMAVNCLLAQGAFAGIDKTQWTALSGQPGDAMQVYQSHQQKERVLTVVHATAPETLPKLTEATLPSEIAAMTKQRKFMNDVLGHENWQIKKYELENAFGGQSLIIEGSYFDEGKEQSFYEVLSYEQKHYSQYQIVEPRSPASLTKEAAMSVLKEAAQP